MTPQGVTSLRPAQAAIALGVSPATLWRWLKERPDFPRPRKLGPRATVWIAAELEEWLVNQPHAPTA
jgi:predicted DNA-binding transcriptional regulator AlpA